MAPLSAVAAESAAAAAAALPRGPGGLLIAGLGAAGTAAGGLVVFLTQKPDYRMLGTLQVRRAESTRGQRSGPRF